MPLLNSTGRGAAKSLYGAGNRNINDDAIRNFINTPNRTAEEIRNQAIQSGVSANQITSAMAGNPNFTQDKVDNYLGSKGIVKPRSASGMSTGQQRNILYGGGNSTISNDEIRNYINQPGKTAEEIQAGALRHGISAKQIQDAMAGDPNYSASAIDSHLTKQGILNPNPVVPSEKQPLTVESERVIAPRAVKPTAITVGTNETVEGRLSRLLSDPHNPLNVQAQTFANQQANQRGLLNSSMAVSAGQDAMMKNAMPIATQDAATFYDAKKTNSGQDLTAGMFNNELGAKVGMFNAGEKNKVGMFNSDQTSREGMFDRQLAHDYKMNSEKLALDKYIATLDNDSKMAIANLELMAQETSVMGEMSKTLMSLYAQTAGDDKISPEVKAEIFNNLKGIQSDIASYMPSFAKAGKSLVFGSSSGANKPADGGSDTGKKGSSKTTGLAPTPGRNGVMDDVGTVKPNRSGDGYTVYLYGDARNPAPNQTDSNDWKLTGPEKSGIERYNRDHNLNIDMNDVIPQEFINHIQQQGQMFGLSYPPELFGVPVQPPGTMRTDMPSYYVWKPAAPKYQG